MAYQGAMINQYRGVAPSTFRGGIKYWYILNLNITPFVKRKIIWTIHLHDFGFKMLIFQGVLHKKHKDGMTVYCVGFCKEVRLIQYTFCWEDMIHDSNLVITDLCWPYSTYVLLELNFLLGGMQFFGKRAWNKLILDSMLSLSVSPWWFYPQLAPPSNEIHPKEDSRLRWWWRYYLRTRGARNCWSGLGTWY